MLEKKKLKESVQRVAINSFKNYLVEEEKTVYFTFGRMNPPTIGHEKLLDAISKAAGSNPYKIYLSQSQDADKNPLAYKEKVKIARKMFPRHARNILVDKGAKNLLEVASKLYESGFKNIVGVVGSDRIREFDTRIKKYNGVKGRHGFYNFEKITIISAGDRDPDADGAAGMSASKMRAAAKDNDFSTFSQGLPRAVKNADAKKIYNSVRSGMGLSEQTNFKNRIQLEPVSDIRESYMDGKLFVTTDNSSYNIAAAGMGSGANGGTAFDFNAVATFIFDVTDTSTHKIKMGYDFQRSGSIYGSSGATYTSITVIRLGDT